MRNDYIWMENLDSKRLLKFVDSMNSDFYKLIGGIRGKLADDVIKYIDVPRVNVIHGFREGVYALVSRGGKYYIKIFYDDGEESDLLVIDGKLNLVGGIFPNWDNSVLGIFLTKGSDRGVFRFIDVDTLDTIGEFEDFYGQIQWIDSDKFLFTRQYRDMPTPDNVPPPASRIHLMDIHGLDLGLIFGKGLPTNYFVSLWLDYSRRWIYSLVRRGWRATKIFYARLGDLSRWDLLYDAGSNYAFVAGFKGDWHIVGEYELDGTRLFAIRESESKLLIKEPARAPIFDAFVFMGELFLLKLVDASDRLIKYDDGSLRDVDLIGGVPSSIRNLDWSDKYIYCVLESFTVPPKLVRLDPENLVCESIYGTHIEGDFIIREGLIKSHDRKDIHMFIVGNKYLDRRTVIVHGYGGFGISMKPFYLGYLLKFIQDGGVYSLVNLRGGREYGEEWHLEGMRERKFNVFMDYIQALRYWKDNGYRVILLGRSNGGLLVAATLNMAPDLADLAIIGYPLTDMLRFHKLYVGGLWVDEYGDPEDPKDREFLLRYSPIHNLKDVDKFPPILVYTGLYDDRVHPSHAFRYAAKVKELGGEIYLRTDMESGHLGSSPARSKDEVIDILSFIYLKMNF